MKFTTSIAMINPAFYVPVAQAAEAAGFEGINLPDSIGYPKESDSTYPYNGDGSREFLENKPFIEPLIATAAMAAATTSIMFRTAVLKLPVRHPVIFAKEVTSLAVMTGNRFGLGIGTSPWPDDYELVGLPWAARGRRFEECIAILQGLSTGEYLEYDGEFYRFPAVKLNPAPTEPVKLIIGGHTDRHIERTARLGDGWAPTGISTDEVAKVVARIHARRAELGRDHLPFEVHAGNADSRSVDGIKRLAEAGVTHVGGSFSTFNPYGLGPDTETLQQKVDALQRFGDEVISHFR
ncbi:MAG TPA: TIGR03619 family F420-dependent LLM class oxidoreductase [Ilumatobacter sp.]|nr:TIGR03619 family F420-dependent LLM class oxidoreductase [Ilumatobacter sp.]